MEIYILQYNYRNRWLVVTIDANVYIYCYDKRKFDQPFLSFQAKSIFIGKSKVCPMTEISGAGDKLDIHGNTFLLECENNEFVYICGVEIFQFKTVDKIIDYISLMVTLWFLILLQLEKDIPFSCQLTTNLLKTIKSTKGLY